MSPRQRGSRVHHSPGVPGWWGSFQEGGCEAVPEQPSCQRMKRGAWQEINKPCCCSIMVRGQRTKLTVSAAGVDLNKRPSPHPYWFSLPSGQDPEPDFTWLRRRWLDKGRFHCLKTNKALVVLTVQVICINTATMGINTFFFCTLMVYLNMIIHQVQ